MMCSFDRVIEVYGLALTRVAAAYEADPALREDLVQEILLAIHEALPRLTRLDRLAPFVFRIAHNRGVTHVMRQVRAKRSVGEDAMTPEPDPEEKLLGDERSQRLAAAIRQLPLSYRQVMTLVLEDMTYAEISETLALSLSNVGVRITRAKSQLRKILNDL